MAVEGLDLTLSPGEVTVLTGPSGGGKTTITRLANGLAPHFFEGKLVGDVTVFGLDVAHAPLWRTAGLVGSVFQNPRTQFFTTSTLDELAFGCENLGVEPGQIERRVARAVQTLGLDGLIDRSVFALSGGEKQILACGSVAAIEPKVYVLDEPSANLDRTATLRLQTALAEWRRAGAAVLVAEHRLHYLADLADRVLVVAGGRVTHDFTGAEFRSLPPSQVAELGLRTISWDQVRPPSPGRPKASGEAAYEVAGLQARYRSPRRGGRKGRPWTLDLKSASFPTGQVTALVGANGAGKSTLALWLAGLRFGRRGTLTRRPTPAGNVAPGTVRRAVGRRRPGELGPAARRQACYLVGQDVGHQLFTESVLDEVALSLRHSRSAPDEATTQEAAAGILEQFDLLGQSARHPATLSGGQKQRLAIAAGFASGRDLIVLDEPTSGLDLAHMRQVADALRRLATAGRTVVVATHDLELVASAAQHAILLEAGRPAGHLELTEESWEAVADWFRAHTDRPVEQRGTEAK
jgi:energy-coupling factor transport system ATP-binding protein